MGLFALFAGLFTAKKVDDAISSPDDTFGQTIIKTGVSVAAGTVVYNSLNDECDDQDDYDEVQNLFDED